MEINLGKIIVEDEINLGKLELDVIKEKPPLEDLEITPTKEEQVFKSQNHYGYDEVKVNAISLQDKRITINENGTHNIVADEGYTGLNQVSVTVDAIEDLGEELETYNTELTEQETTIDNIIEMLKSKGMDNKEEVVINANTEEDVNNIINQAVYTYIKNSKRLAVETYDIYSNEPATLYTPSKEHTNYLIRCRGTNNYGIVWFGENISLQRTFTGADFYVFTPRFVQYQIKDKMETFSVFEGGYNTTTVGYVSSTTYTTFEEAVEAIKSPDTVYSTSSNASTFTAQIPYNTSHASYLALASNMACYTTSGEDFEKSRRISSDETIIVIGTGEVLTNE